MSHFDKAILSVLEHEGGYCNVPQDPGGETNYGICKRNYPQLDIKSLTKTSAINIYRADYWRGYYDEMPYAIAAKVFDMAVNMGHSRASKILQKALHITADGVIGKQTLAAVNSADVQTLLDNITKEQAAYYKAIVDKRPASNIFMAGWLNRANWHPSV